MNAYTQAMKFCIPYYEPICTKCRSSLITHESIVEGKKVYWKFYCPLCLTEISREVIQILDRWVQNNSDSQLFTKGNDNGEEVIEEGRTNSNRAEG
jgi:hypothetical protein